MIITSCRRLTSITFQDGCLLRTLTTSAFSSCDLREFTIPENIAVISGTAFNRNYNLAKIDVHPSNKNFWSNNSLTVFNMKSTVLVYCVPNVGESFTVPSTVKILNTGCFCSSRCTSIILQDGLEKIEYYSFAFSNIKNIIIPDSVTIMEDSIFLSCSQLISVNLSKSIESIGANCFKQSALKSIIIPDSVTSIGRSAFSECAQLGDVYMPSNLQELGGEVFPPNSNLIFPDNSNVFLDNQLLLMDKSKTFISQCFNVDAETINIPPTISVIKKGAFKQKKKIKSITCSGVSQLTTIEDFAFQSCTSLSSFPFFSTITFIGESSFYGCNLSSSIEFNSLISEIGISSFRRNKITSIRFKSASSARELFEIPLLTIKNNAFSNCYNLASFEFPSSASVTIQDYVFSDCTSLASIIIPNNVLEIGAGCFSNSGLTSIEFDNNVAPSDRIPSFFLMNCVGLSSFTFPSNVVTLGISSLSNTSITSLVVPDSIETIEQHCFMNCIKLTSLTITSSSSLKTLGFGVFQGCISFKSVSNFESSHFVSDNGAIYSSDRSYMYVYPPASPNKFFAISDRVRTISQSSFIGCTNLEIVLIPDNSVTTIKSCAFQDCINLKTVNIPLSVTTVEPDAFLNCRCLLCGVIVQNKSPSFISMLLSSGLRRSSLTECGLITCEVHHGLYLYNALIVGVFIFMFE